MNNFVSWRRVSTQKQGRSGLGLEAQKEIIDYFVEKDKGKILADYVEVYTGTELSKCKELSKAIQFAKEHDAKLIIAKTDRFRNTLEALQIYEELGDGKIIFCDLPSTDKFTLTLFFALSEREALITSIRTKAALAAKKARGEQTGGTKKLWGKNTGANRTDTISTIQQSSSTKRKENARNNVHNAQFWTFIQKWISCKGEPNNAQIWAQIASELNDYNFKTATGMEYNAVRAAAMYRKLKKIMP